MGIVKREEDDSMASAPNSMARRYTPLLVLAAVQVLLVALAPSNAPNSTASSSTSLGAAGAGSGINASGTGGIASGTGGGSGTGG
ncbi:MAG: hypothetical protein ACYCZV_14260, partial [Acidimicrobiales bacterium]